jgi:hypothetical protein
LATDQGFIKFFRGKEWYAFTRAFKLYVNGEEIGKIKRGKEIIVEVSPGVHTVYASMDGFQTEEAEVTVDAGQTITFQVTGSTQSFVTLKML